MSTDWLDMLASSLSDLPWLLAVAVGFAIAVVLFRRGAAAQALMLVAAGGTVCLRILLGLVWRAALPTVFDLLYDRLAVDSVVVDVMFVVVSAGFALLHALVWALVIGAALSGRPERSAG